MSERGSAHNYFTVCGMVDYVKCDHLFLDSGSEITCVAERLVPIYAFTSKTTLLHASANPESQLLAKGRLHLFDFDKIVEVAVVRNLSDDALLGSDLGLSTLAMWLLKAEHSAKSVKFTKAQAVLNNSMISRTIQLLHLTLYQFCGLIFQRRTCPCYST